MTVQITVVDTSALGDRSYVVTAGTVAVVIDPQRDVDRFMAVADSRGARITHVLETHIHNDYVTGGLELASRCGAQYCVAAGDEVGFDRRPVADGELIDAGPFRLVALHTPGHTPNHLSYALEDGGRRVAVFTGGSLLFGTVGRTDLISEEMTPDLARAQWRSARRLVAELPGDAEVHPTHGFGSFCASAAGSGASSSTIGEESGTNLALTVEDEDEFVARLLGGLSPYPRYYVHMAPLNRGGPPPVALDDPRPVDADELRRRAKAGEWVVDLRARRAFARLHLAGTLSVELGGSFATYLGWAIPWGSPLTLIGETAEQVRDARRELVRIGIDDLAGAAVGRPDEIAGDGELQEYRVAGFAELAAEGGRAVLDVRLPDEWRDGHVAGATHIPFYELEDRLAEVPDGDEVWVYCASGFRASLAASVLHRGGRTPVLIDDEWQRAAGAGVEVAGGPAAGRG